MKHKLIVYTSLICLAIGFSNCNSFFDVEPTGMISEKEYSCQINNLRLSLNSVYNLMQSYDYQMSELVFGECMSDNAYNKQDNDGSELCQLLNFQFNTQNKYILSRYEVNYKGINLANQVISAVPKLEYNANYSTTTQEIRYILGQAKLLRALFYFNLVKTYGGVSIQPESSALSDTIVPRSSADEVYAYIEKDLREACLILYRNRYKESNAGQAAVGAGLGLLMKVLVYQASPGIKLENPDRATKWQEAVEIGKLFIDGKSMTYGDMLKFDKRYTKETWDEVMKRLALTDQSPTKGSVISGDVANIHSLVPFEELFKISHEFNAENLLEINHYDYSNSGSSIEETNYMYYCFTDNEDYDVGLAPTDNLTSLRDADPRGLYTVASETTSDFFKDENGNSCSLSWYNIGLGWVFTKYMVYPSEGSKSERNYVVMRYADAILLYAEALNETGDQASATTVLNRVRQRAANLLLSSCSDSKYNKCTSCPLYSAMPYEEVKKNIRYERRIELAAEMDRWWDIVRTGIVGERMTWMANNAAADKNSGKPRWRGKYFKKGVNELFPIPQNEITISNGVITQNFGY